VAPFSELQSARLAGVGRHEITPAYSALSVSEEGGSERIQNHFGLHYATGLSSRVDLRARFERVSVVDSEGEGVNVLGIGPKFALVPDRLALYAPVGFGFGSGLEIGDTFQLHPALVGTVPVGNVLELNPSVKALLPLSAGSDFQYAANIGIGLSSDLSRWAIRPEIGWLWNPSSEEGSTVRHFSVGFSLFTGSRR
jgi:hypothetical protein